MCWWDVTISELTKLPVLTLSSGDSVVNGMLQSEN